MPIPKFDETMLPILKALQDDKTIMMQELSDKIQAEYFELTEEEKKKRYQAGIADFLTVFRGEEPI